MRLLGVLSMFFLIGCSSYRYQSYEDHVDACIHDVVKDEYKCERVPTYHDELMTHEMTPVDIKYLPAPDDY